MLLFCWCVFTVDPRWKYWDQMEVWIPLSIISAILLLYTRSIMGKMQLYCSLFHMHGMIPLQAAPEMLSPCRDKHMTCAVWTTINILLRLLLLNGIGLLPLTIVIRMVIPLVLRIVIDYRGNRSKAPDKSHSDKSPPTISPQDHWRDYCEICRWS